MSRAFTSSARQIYLSERTRRDRDRRFRVGPTLLQKVGFDVTLIGVAAFEAKAHLSFAGHSARSVGVAAMERTATLTPGTPWT
jgi:hypothetical protein